MLYYKDPAVAASLMQCEFGIEKESLRIMEDGSFSHTPHPFLNEKNIVRDFCENQLEVNTGVSDTEEGAIEELEAYEKKVREVLRDLPEREYL